MNKQDTEKFKTRLLEEKTTLESELGKIGKKDSSSPGGWEATSGNIDTDSADDNEVADNFEEIEGNSAIVTNLEKQLSDVDAALEKINNGTYGICEVCGEPIERERLEANPSSRISIKHAHK